MMNVIVEARLDLLDGGPVKDDSLFSVGVTVTCGARNNLVHGTFSRKDVGDVVGKALYAYLTLDR